MGKRKKKKRNNAHKNAALIVCVPGITSFSLFAFTLSCPTYHSSLVLYSFFFFKDLLSQRKKKKKKTTKEKKKMLFFFSFLVSDRATMKTTNWPPRSVCPLKTRQIKYRFFFFLSLPCQNVRLRTHKEFAVSSGFDKTNSRELLRFASHTREKKNN